MQCRTHVVAKCTLNWPWLLTLGLFTFFNIFVSVYFRFNLKWMMLYCFERSLPNHFTMREQMNLPLIYKCWECSRIVIIFSLSPSPSPPLSFSLQVSRTHWLHRLIESRLPCWVLDVSSLCSTVTLASFTAGRRETLSSWLRCCLEALLCVSSVLLALERNLFYILKSSTG